MAKRPVLVPWDVQPFEAGVIADEYLGGLSTVIDGGQVAFNRYVAAVGTGYNVKGTRSYSRSGRGFLGSASSIITAETTALSTAPVFEIAGGDWTFQIVIDNVGGGGTNPGFWRAGTTYADGYFVIQNAATRRPWVRVINVDVLKPATGPQWVTGQKLNLLVRFKNASSCDAWWDGKKQHTATHSTTQAPLTANQAIHGLMLQSDVSQFTSGNAVAIRFWNRYLSDAAVARINEDELALYQPRSVFVSLSAGGGTTSITKDQALAWDVRGALSKDQALAWDVRGALSKDQALAWDVRGSVTRDQSLSWNIRGALTKDQSIAWDVRGSVTRDQSLSWNIRGSVTKDQPLAWDVRGSVTRDQLITWDIVNGSQVVVDQTITWNIRGAITKDQPLTWNIRGAVTKDQALLWSIRGLLAKDQALAWDIRNSVTRDQLITWDILNTLQVIVDQPLSWNVRGAVIKDQALLWSIQGDSYPDPTRIRISFQQLNAVVTRVVR